jgi:hypothetical protein
VRFDWIGFLALYTALIGAALGACHEPSGANSVAPLSSAPLAAPAASVSASPEGPGSASDAAVNPVPVSSAAALAADSGSASPVNASAHPNADSNAIPTGDGAASLLDAQGKPLPQTDERPSTTSVAFRERVEAVAKAITSGNAEPALAAFFPLVAYQQVKDVAKPERDYKFRLQANFKRDVLEYHHALGAEAAQATFTGVTVSEKDAKWMEPGSEGNKLGYFRVLRSRLHFTLPAGRSRDFELTSLISWRGEWYVVHLHGFK